MKRILLFVLTLALALSFTACSGGDAPQLSPETSINEPTPTQTAGISVEPGTPLSEAELAALAQAPSEPSDTELPDDMSVVAELSETQYSAVSGKQVDLSGYDRIGVWSEGLCAVIKNGALSFVDENGATADIPIEPRVYGKYDPLPKFSGGVAVLCKDVLDSTNNYHLAYGTINRLGKTIVNFEYSKMEIFDDGYTLAEYSYGDWGEWTVFDKAGNVLVAEKKPLWIRTLTVEGEYVFVYITDINSAKSSYDIYRKDGSLATESTFDSLEEAMAAVGLR